MNALKKVFYDPPIEPCDCEPQTDLLELPFKNDNHPRRTSGASSVSGYCSEGADRDRSMSGDSGGLRCRPVRRMHQQQSTIDQETTTLTWIPETMATDAGNSTITIIHGTEMDVEVEQQGESSSATQEGGYLGVPGSTISASGSADTLTPSGPSSPSNLSAMTLVGSTGSAEKVDATPTDSSSSFQYGKAPTSPLPERVVPKRPPRTIEMTSTTDTITVTSKINLPQSVMKPNTEQKLAEINPSVIKVIPFNISTTNVNLSSSTIVTASTLTTISTTNQSTISPPSIGLTFDRYEKH